MPDWQRKAEAESLLRRANADVRPVRVRGYVPPDERVRWSALRLEKRIMRSGVWQRLAMNEAGLSEEQPLELLRGGRPQPALPDVSSRGSAHSPVLRGLKSRMIPG